MGTTYSAAWLSTGGGPWTRVTVPADHGAGPVITGLGFDGSGLVAVRPGRSARGAGDGVVYFSPHGGHGFMVRPLARAPASRGVGGQCPARLP